MNYFIQRDGKEYGPYLLADLQRYVASGNVLLTDMARSEAMTDWMPVSSIIGSIPVPTAPAPQGYQPMASPYPLPPGLHWGLVLLLCFITCGIFTWVWAFVQAAYVRKLVPKNKAMVWFGVALAVSFGSAFIAAFVGTLHGARDLNLMLLPVRIAGLVLVVVGNFSLKSGLEEHFNSAENIGLSLSGVMTFFFGILYIQYHLSRIREARMRPGMFATGI